MTKRTRTDETSKAAAKAGRDLVLSSGQPAKGSGTLLRSNEREESPALRAWIRRYVALVAEADVEARGSSGKEPEGP